MTVVAEAPRAHDARAPYVGTTSVTAGISPMGVLGNIENDVSRIVLQPAIERLGVLRSFKQNWDGCGALAASKHLISRSIDLLGNYYQIAVHTGFGWSNPVLNLNDDGNLVMEWWRGLKKLTIYVAAAEKPVFVRVWGDDIDTEMDDGTIGSIEGFAVLWIFLNS